MPKPPGIIDKVNYVVKFIEDPCHAPWTVYIETALEAVGDMFLAYASPSPQDVLRFYIKPKSQRSAGKFLRDVESEGELDEELELLPDINELVSTYLPFSERLSESAVHDRIRWFWVIDGVLERILWYWFVAEMLTDFAFEWTSALNASEQCSADLGGSALVSREDQFMFFAGIWHPVEPGTVRKSWGGVVATTNCTIQFATTSGTVVGGCNVTATPGVASIIVGLFLNADINPIEVREFNVSHDPSAIHSVAFSRTATLGSLWHIAVMYTEGSVEQLGISISEFHLAGFGDSTNSGVPDSIEY